MSKTIRVSERDVITAGVDLDSFPNAGPYPSITGMRNLYWGKNALVVRCGVYAYHVDKPTFERLGGFIND
jgi:hypothetical protein